LLQDAELSQAYNQVVNSTGNNIFLSDNLVYKLDSLGLIKLSGYNYEPFCELYRLFFQKSLLIESNAIPWDKLKKENEKLQLLVNIDKLTQVANRKCFDETLEIEWERMTYIQEPLSLILADLDNFKFHNDTYGHQSGDNCLHKIAQAINSVIKNPDHLVARYGGEEFVLILPQVDAEAAIFIAEEIRETVKSLRIKIPELTKKNQVTNMISLTISLGIACIIPSGDFSLREFFEAADQAMYQAKKLGRDRTILSSKFKFGYDE
jgi:diguanylate cyclase (GGDEF)-like protein